jgi:hypothetical protein
MILLMLAVSACNLVSRNEFNNIQNQTATAVANNRPVITILSPPDGAEFTVGTQVLVSVNATDAIGVTRVTLSVLGNTVDTQQSESPTGSTNLNALLDFTPQQAGPTQLVATAFRGNVASNPAVVTINVRANQAQVTATLPPQPVPSVNPNDPTCRALVNVGLNVRSGPATSFPVITTLAAGSVVPILGRTGANDWWQVRVSAVIIGWVNSSFTTVLGICTGIPVLPSPPTPTSSAPTATFTSIPPTNTLTLTALPPTPTSTPGLPDLVITSIIAPSSVALNGNPSVDATFAVTVSNTGQSPAGAFEVTLGVLSQSPVQIGVVANLLPGQSIVLNGTLTFTSTGTFTVVATADPTNQVSEVSEVNNTGTVTITVTP